MEESETRSSNDGGQDSHTDSVDTEYEQPTSSRKRKVKVTASSCKLKIIAPNDSGNELPLSPASEGKGKQPARPASVAGQTRSNKRVPSTRSMIITSDEEPAPREALVQETSLLEEPDRLSTEHHPQPSAGRRNELPSIEQPNQPVSVNSCMSSSLTIMAEAATECSEPAPPAEPIIECCETDRAQPLRFTSPFQEHPPIPNTKPRDGARDAERPSVSDVEMSAAPGVVEQKVVEESANLPGHTQTLPSHSNSSSQNRRPRPRQVHNAAGRVQRNDTGDAFSLRTRQYPTCTSTTDATTISTASAQLLAAEEGLIGGNQEVSRGNHDAQHLNSSLEISGHQAVHSPIPPPASYDAANPFARPPQAEAIPDRLPGPGMRPLYAQQPGVSQDMHYNVDNNSSWYTTQQGPYPSIPYISQHYRPAYPLPDPRGPPTMPIAQPEHTAHGSHNAPLRYLDMYHPGMVSGNEQYRFAYREPAYYPFHPARPPPACPTPVSRLDGNENPSRGANHPPDVFGGDKDAQGNDCV
ncbi:hypothetical protein EDD15DRAFT_2200391 [Pisolithus albus]|nr:hypothetical protein EDD15DRAFT_2200391 [Pisolithus albus]